MGTIVQEYGPIYGEAVNGTVQGRPNGSVFVPLSNTITLSIDQDYVKVYTNAGGTFFILCRANGTGIGAMHYLAAAEAQDLASNISVDLYSDALLTTKVGSKAFTAGLFNVSEIAVPAIDPDTPQVGDTLYLVATLVNNNTPVATSSVLEVELVS